MKLIVDTYAFYKKLLLFEDCNALFNALKRLTSDYLYDSPKVLPDMQLN
jgi:hypothetical protein